MTAEILAVGTELLLGQITNTNAQYLSMQLANLGINVFYHTVVGDNPERLKKAAELALSRADVLITTGGLGPTKDDLTKEVLSDFFNKELIFHEPSHKMLIEYFDKIKRPMAKINEKQIFMPKDCFVLINDNGTAPGAIIEDNGKMLVMLPGPPSEMKPMFDNYVKPYLAKKSDVLLVSRVVRIIGMGESNVATLLDDMLTNSTNPTVAPYAKEGELTLRITARCQSEAEGEALIKPVQEEINRVLGEYIYSFDDVELNEIVVKMLIEKKLTIATAESCTGGMMGQLITSVAGASSVYKEGIITYSNEAKIKYLNVSKKTLDEFGAVSKETAIEMAQGLKNSTGADVAVSVTGIAGPGGATENKKVGLVYIAICYKDKVECSELNLFGDRDRIRRVSCLNLLDLIRKNII